NTNTTHTINAQVMISNDAAFRSGNSIIECDLFLTLGGGTMQINRSWKYLIEIGGGMKVYMPIPWLAVRFDVASYLHPTPKPTGNSFNADLAINAGVSFLLPVHKVSDDNKPK
ncbi:MAG: hypothetical protein WC956_11245, partial [bacterium]